MNDLLSAALLLAGGFFCLVAALGLLRLSDVYCRMHAATKAGTLGVALIALSLMLRAESWPDVVAPLFVFVFMIATAPVGAHLIGRAAFHANAPTDPSTSEDEEAASFREGG